MPVYDSVEFDPPAPLAYVTLRDPVTRTTRSEISMLLDTGAGVSLVPERIVRQLGVAVTRDRDYPKLQIVAIADLLHGAEIKMPPTASTFKQAQKAEDARVKQSSFDL